MVYRKVYLAASPTFYPIIVGYGTFISGHPSHQNCHFGASRHAPPPLKPFRFERIYIPKA